MRNWSKRKPEHRSEEFNHIYEMLRLSRKNVKTKAQARTLEHTITVDDIHNLYTSQKGCCAISGIKLIMPAKRDGGANNPWVASLDRIDSSKGYVPGNVQLLCRMANYAKKNWTDADVIAFAQHTADWHRK
jgi:hypothetical protein